MFDLHRPLNAITVAIPSLTRLEPSRPRADLSNRTEASPWASAWSCCGAWRMSLRDLQRASDRGSEDRLDRHTARAIRQALASLPEDVLLPGEAGIRRAALSLLHRPLACLRGGPRLSPSEVGLVTDAVRLGEDCAVTGPATSRRPRTAMEADCLRHLAEWVRAAPGNTRQRAAVVEALRRPEFRHGQAIARWREPTSHGDLGALELPRRELLEPLVANPPMSLALCTHSLRFGDAVTFRAGAEAFASMTLRPERLPPLDPDSRMPANLHGLDLRALPSDIDWPHIEPLRARCLALNRIDVVAGQLSGPAPYGWMLGADLADLHFSPGLPVSADLIDGHAGGGRPTTLDSLLRTLKGQIGLLSGDDRHRLAALHFPRMDQIAREAAANPAFHAAIEETLSREVGLCLDANLMRLDDIEARLQAGNLHTLEDAASFLFRQAMLLRARQAVADRGRNNGENLETASGRAWEIDQRLTHLLGASNCASRPYFDGLAGLEELKALEELEELVRGSSTDAPHLVADELIADEVRRGFPTLGYLVAEGQGLASIIEPLLARDAVLLREQTTIQAVFDRDRAAAVQHAPDDPEAGYDAFLVKEQALARVRVDRLVAHLDGPIDRLRAAGVLRATDVPPRGPNHSSRT